MHASKNKTCLIVVLLMCCCSVQAQLVDHVSTFRTIDNKSYFRFHYDNDYFTKTDYYYSQGITLEYVHPSIEKFPLSKLLIKPPAANLTYGLAFNIFGYTPTSIRSDSILYGDRPYASCLSFKTFAIASDSARQQRISSAISIGIIGPAAQGEEIQTGIHRWLKNVLPKGWQYQVKNDIIIDYQMSYEKKLLDLDNHFLLNYTAEARLGTLNDKLGGGFNFMSGNFNNPYQPAGKNKKKLAWYLYGQSRLYFIGYDASLQGGLFNHQSPYTVSSRNVSRVVYQADAGVIVNFQKLYLSYTQSFLTKEFATGIYHRWGGVSLGFSF
jgi:lipid A 3-O-deacylase